MDINNLKIINNITDSHISQLIGLYHGELGTKDRTEKDVQRMIKNTDFIFAVTDLEEKILYGFSRVLSDNTYFALIFDLIVNINFRNIGIGSFILETIKNHHIISNVKYIELCCGEKLVPFYKKRGFKLSDGRMNIVNLNYGLESAKL